MWYYLFVSFLSHFWHIFVGFIRLQTIHRPRYVQSRHDCSLYDNVMAWNPVRITGLFFLWSTCYRWRFLSEASNWEFLCFFAVAMNKPSGSEWNETSYVMSSKWAIYRVITLSLPHSILNGHWELLSHPSSMLFNAIIAAMGFRIRLKCMQPYKLNIFNFSLSKS